MLRVGESFEWKGKLCKVYAMKRGAFDYYREMIRNNERVTYREACLKMTRNILLSKSLGVNEHGKHLYGCCLNYGNLLIYTNQEDDKVKWIENRVGEFEFNVNEKDKAELEKILFESESKIQCDYTKHKSNNKNVVAEAQNDIEPENVENKGLLHNIKNRIFGFKTKEVKANA